MALIDVNSLLLGFGAIRIIIRSDFVLIRAAPFGWRLMPSSPTSSSSEEEAAANETGMVWQQAYVPLVVALVLPLCSQGWEVVHDVVDAEGYCRQEQQALLLLRVFHCERTRPKASSIVAEPVGLYCLPPTEEDLRPPDCRRPPLQVRRGYPRCCRRMSHLMSQFQNGANLIMEPFFYCSCAVHSPPKSATFWQNYM